MKILFPLSNPGVVWLVDRWPRPRTVMLQPGDRSFSAWSESPAAANALVDAVATRAGPNSFVINAADPMHEAALRRRAGKMGREYPCGIFVLSREAAVAGSTAPVFARKGMFLDTLTPEDAKVVDDNWKFRQEGFTLSEVRRIIESGLPTACVRLSLDTPNYASKDSSQGGGGESAATQRGAPVAWVLGQEYGSQGMLHTVEAYRRQGLAGVVVRALAERQLALGYRPFCYIEVNNAASRGLFESLGFRREGDRGWFYASGRKEG